MVVAQWLKGVSMEGGKYMQMQVKRLKKQNDWLLSFVRTEVRATVKSLCQRSVLCHEISNLLFSRFDVYSLAFGATTGVKSTDTYPSGAMSPTNNAVASKTTTGGVTDSPKTKPQEDQHV